MKKKIIRDFFKCSHFSAPLVIAFLLLSSINASAQLRNYAIVYSDNAKGSVALIGNTLMNLANDDNTPNIIGMNDNAANGNSTYTNGFRNMQYVDIDGATGDGAATRNSSSSDLILPGGTNTIKLARLYWGGRVNVGDFDLNIPANRTIKVRKGTSGAYQEYQAQQIDSYISGNTAIDSNFYQAYVDITGYVTTNGAGTYTVGNAPLTKGFGGNQGNYGGWCIVVVYENAALNFNSIRVYDGFQKVGVFGDPIVSTVTLSGLDVPGALNLSDATMGVVSWEGDANFKRDFLKVNDNLFSNAINPADNPMNGTISTNGVHITTKNPNYTNQMGIDIDQFDAGTGYGILPGATTVKLEFGTEQDQYFPGLFSFVIKRNEPAVNLTKTVTDANGNNEAEAGELLTYTLRGVNTGGGNANNIVVADTLPSTVTYVPNSLVVVYSPGVAAGSLTDAENDDNAEYISNGVNTVRFRLGNTSSVINGGIIPNSDSFVVQFQVKINTPAPGEALQPIINIARLIGTNDASQQFTDDGIAILNPALIDLPVLLKSFNVLLSANSQAKILWSTAQEINTKNFEIERSPDNRIFATVATIAAAGNSATDRNYQANDNLLSISNAVVYYRLKQIDIDGKISYSRVLAVRLKKNGNGIVVSPNPFNSYVTVNVDWTKTENTVVKVYSMVGKEVISKNVQLQKGSNFITIDDLGSLQAGNYIIQFTSADGKLIKQITKQ